MVMLARDKKIEYIFHMQKKLMLASASPRRSALLKLIGLDFEVAVSDVNEDVPASAPHELVEHLARKKAQAVFSLYPDRCVIGADTIVVLDSMILNKPRDKADAERLLRLLSGREHVVFTGVAVLCGKHVLVRHERTKVRFKELTDEEIINYIETGEPMDKAGAYGIQGRGAVFITRIEGCYFNVVGLPLFLLNEMLNAICADQ